MAENMAAMLMDYIIGAPESVAIGIAVGFVLKWAMDKRRKPF